MLTHEQLIELEGAIGDAGTSLVLQPGATPERLEEVETRLGFTLPEELAYLVGLARRGSRGTRLLGLAILAR
jgi:hypothetical protein